ncbi:hypothetical protein GSI_14284 [Ganoderma sinense ZZ0214-1]|uniref:Uncharacterized protein n=1 Tax=Ganoderma sinense ZZ0214-1 TaxID=1077348 RepID=A0A2G8RT55_9APHY|nr:hypothetical protein GSI_14284 [Ganoderma sinense ZZ0214-1]
MQINCLWFLSLGVAFVSIPVEWWLQGHRLSSCTDGARPRTPEECTRAHHRHAAWGVQATITALLVPLVPFCAGLSILLITLDMTVGAVAMGMIGFFFIFSAATTAFLSPNDEGWTLHELRRTVAGQCQEDPA